MRDAARRANFITYFHEVLKGDRERLKIKSKLTKGRISQLFDPDEAFGERAAAGLAVRLGLDSTYFDPKPQEISQKPRAVPDLAASLQTLARALGCVSAERRPELLKVFDLLASHPDEPDYLSMLAKLLGNAGPSTSSEKRQSNGR